MFDPSLQRNLLVRPEDAARLLSVSRTTVYGLLQSGALRSVKVGGLRRIPYDALEEFVGQLCRDQGGGPRPVGFVDAEVDGSSVLRAGQPAGAGRPAAPERTDARAGDRRDPGPLGVRATGRHDAVAP